MVKETYEIAANHVANELRTLTKIILEDYKPISNSVSSSVSNTDSNTDSKLPLKIGEIK